MATRSGSKKQSAAQQSNRARATKVTAPPLAPLTVEDARQLPKPHTGFEQFVEPLASVVDKYGDAIGTDGVDVSAMREGLAFYQTLQAQRKVVAEQLALIDDTMLRYGSQAWVQELVIYGHARTAGKTNSAIRGAIEPFARFMQQGPRKAKKTVAPGSAPTTPSSNNGNGTSGST